METVEDGEYGSRGVPHARSLVSLSNNEYLVLRSISEASEKIYGAEISRRTGITSGALSRILEKLEENDWIVSELETGNERELGRRLRVYHSITTNGSLRLLKKAEDIERKKRRLEKELSKLRNLLEPLWPSKALT